MRVLLLAAGATFLAMLDATVANLAIADLDHDFRHATIADLSWVVTAYAVPFAALLTPAGRLAGVVGTLIGIGMGALTTGTSTAAALSVAPARFADATGLNTTARQLGGAFGVAVLAVLLPAAPAVSDYAAIYVFCGAAALAAGLAGLGLRAPGTAPARAIATPIPEGST